MAAPDARPSGTVTPVAVVWCRQVDNEAESPGYTTIPEDFSGRRETLEAIRIVGNLTINVADTHDYWDPEPGQPLSYYPNLFLYPAAGGRYTCVGRMFLSTEDRPRLGMKTLVLETAPLLAGGEFGATVLRAHASMGSRAEPRRPTAEPDASVYQAVGEGFLFHRGTTEPVVLVAAEQWDPAAQVVRDLVRLMPSSLVALGAFLVFPYFLPEAKVNLHEFTEQIPLALALMRVAKGEAQGDRHAKRLASWEEAPVSLRDLTKPISGKSKDPFPLVLQYVRDHAEPKVMEVARRVDLVDTPRTRAALDDAERQSGRDRRKEMWRIGTAMETAALLLSRPKGRSVPMSGETAKRVNEYMQARPPEGAGNASADPVASPLPAAPVVTPTGTPQLPPWLQRPADVAVPPPGPVAVPVSVSDDPSARPPSANGARPAAAPAPAALPIDPELVSKLMREMDARLQRFSANLPPSADLASFDLKIQSAVRDLEAKWAALIDSRVREIADAQSRYLESIQGDLGARVSAVEARPTVTPTEVTAHVDEGLQAAVAPRMDELSRRLAVLESRPTMSPNDVTAHLADGLQTTVTPQIEELSHRLSAIEARPTTTPSEVVDQIDQRIQAVDPKFAALEQKVRDAVKISGEAWAERLRAELQAAVDDLAGKSAQAEEELRTALVAQLDLEIRETKDQGTALREEIETRVRDLLKERLTEVDTKRAKDVRDLEQRLGLLVDGRSKDLETRVSALIESIRAKAVSVDDDRVSQTERRLTLEQEARAAELAESQTQTLAGFQVRMQSFFEQKLRENQEREREKYVELLARFKGEVDQSLSRTIDSGRFDVAVQERVARALVAVREEQEKVVAAGVADAELRLRATQEEGIARLEHVEGKIQQRENDLSRVERTVRHDIEELDRRVEVLTDRMLPLVRRTWEKVGEIEKGGGTPVEADAQVKELRRELTRELRRVEGELLEQTSELRDKLEATLQSQGRIWLNFVRQLSAAGEELAPPAGLPGARPLRRPLRAPVGATADDDPMSVDLPEVEEVGAFDSDPVNPLDPRAESPPSSSEREPRRRTRRSTPG
jgi:hypothetical protein